jgi:hypothetical protein
MQRRTVSGPIADGVSVLDSIVDQLNHHLFKRSFSGRVPIRGDITFDILRADGTREQRKLRNLIMDAGEDEAAKLLVGLAADAFTWIALGIDNDPAPDDEQTALNSEVVTNGGERDEDEDPETNGNVATIAVTFSFTGALALTEVGLFNAAAVGDMFSRQIYDVINVKNGDAMTVTWAITLGVSRV